MALLSDLPPRCSRAPLSHIDSNGLIFEKRKCKNKEVKLIRTLFSTALRNLSERQHLKKLRNNSKVRF